MKNVEDQKAIQVYVPKLPDTPGWVALPYDKQQKLVEHTSHIVQARRTQRVCEFIELVELTQVQQLLEGEALKMRSYLRLIYPGQNERFLSRKLQAFRELSTTIPNSVLKRITSVGEDVLSKFDRIAQAPLGDIQNALREMPLLPVNTEKDAEKYLGELDEKILKERKRRRLKGMKLHKDEDYAVKMATNALLHYLKATGLKTSAEKRQWFKRVFGYAMEAQAVPGVLSISRVPIPEGLIIRRGRPIGSKTRREEAA